MRSSTLATILLMLLAPSAASAQSVTLSVFADAPGNDHQNLNDEYVTLSDGGSADLDIGGWRICDAASHCFSFPRGASIPSGGRVRLYTGSGRTSGPAPRASIWAAGGPCGTTTGTWPR